MSEIHFRSHFWPFQINTYFIFWKFLTKWPPAPILDIRNSLSIAFLAISDRYATLFLLEIFDEMAAVGHFGCPKFTFDRISGHFRSMRNFFWIFFYKMAAGGHFGCSKITFDCISGHFRSIGHFGCLKFTFDGIFGHFRSMRILIIFQNIWQNGRLRPFWMSENNFQSHFLPFQIDTQLFFFFWQNDRWRPFWMRRQCQLSNSSEIFGWVMHVSSLKNVV